MAGVVSRQPGPLVIAERVDGVLPCGAGGTTIDLGGHAVATFAANETTLAVTFEPRGDGYTAVAIDARQAVRTLVLMKEYAMELHVLGAFIHQGAIATGRGGLLGVPYEIPGALPGHDMEGVEMEGGGVRIDYAAPGAEPAGVSFCRSPQGAASVLFDRNLHVALHEGATAHLVLLADPRFAQPIPRPLDESTTVVQANLVIPRHPAEDVAAAARPDARAAAGIGLTVAGALALLVAARPPEVEPPGRRR